MPDIHLYPGYSSYLGQSKHCIQDTAAVYDNLNIVSLDIARDGSFSFFFKRSFRFENDDEKTKNETIVFKNVGF